MLHGAEASQMVTSEKILILLEVGYANMSVFGKHLEVTEHYLLATKPFSFSYANNIVNCVYPNDATKKYKDDQDEECSTMNAFL